MMFNKFKNLKNEDGAGALATIFLVALGVIIGFIAVKLFFTVAVIALKLLFAGAFILGIVLLALGVKGFIVAEREKRR